MPPAASATVATPSVRSASRRHHAPRAPRVVAPLAGGVRLYQVSIMCLYFAYGMIFLLASNRLSVTRIGAWFTATGPAIQVWGAAFLVAAACVNWSLIEPESARARAVALLSVLFVAGAWGTAGLAITLLYGLDPTRIVFWAWFIFVTLFVQVSLAPRALKSGRQTLGEMPHLVYEALVQVYEALVDSQADANANANATAPVDAPVDAPPVSPSLPSRAPTRSR